MYSSLLHSGKLLHSSYLAFLNMATGSNGQSLCLSVAQFVAVEVKSDISSLLFIVCFALPSLSLPNCSKQVVTVAK